ncbi:hypothetical protein CEQ90_01370 [Lewinellaceae bacterium SD302]|nr:hypothetical protein CEQ90_01370 [Lewinellaceae bacterium SD302]
MTTIKYGAKGIPLSKKPANANLSTRSARPGSQAAKSNFLDVRVAVRRRRRKQKQILGLSISLALVLLTMLALWLSG